ncbi:hypothetical protein HK414_00670 [Ramlibacter terrae]|uniref:Uncharacterized protein n=1 Tax=Ramlibacter terrae TaxID=2732511 RepID=A0ABX6NZS3_9BURK|nr:hypothetical protein HK414_00670 [Ramlibacter terrae]
MARFIQAEFPTEHAGITRFTRGFAAVRALDVTLSHPVLAVWPSSAPRCAAPPCR